MNTEQTSKNIFTYIKTHYGETVVAPVFQGFSANISKTFIFAGRLATRLSMKFRHFSDIS